MGFLTTPVLDIKVWLPTLSNTFWMIPLKILNLLKSLWEVSYVQHKMAENFLFMKENKSYRTSCYSICVVYSQEIHIYTNIVSFKTACTNELTIVNELYFVQH